MFYGHLFDEAMYLHYHHCVNCDKDVPCYVVSCSIVGSIDEKEFGTPSLCSDCQTKTQQLEDTMTLADRETPVDGIKCDQKWFEQYNSQEVFNGLKK
jgi:hypothetical protein